MATLSFTLQRVALKVPLSRADADAVQQELKEILASSYFRNSKRYPAFLTYIVETALWGDAGDTIKERSIGIEAFGRPPDYDTNLDPIVRNTAHEVRKRLALYYAEHPSLESRVEISLQPGNYIPEFHLFNPHPVAAHPVEPSPSESPALHEQESQTALLPVAEETIVERAPEATAAAPGKARRSRYGSLGLWGIGLLLLAGLVFVWRGERTPSSGQSLWADFFATQHEVLIVVPEAPYPPNTTPPNWARDNPDIALEDLTAVLPPTGVLMEHHVPYNVKLDPVVTLADLINRPVILVGGPTNKWTVTLTDSLRYRMKQDATGLYVRDFQQHLDPICGYDMNKDGSVNSDCAIVARFHSALTASTVMVIAGTGRNGTQAAGQWIVSPNLESRLSELFPGGWANKNIEVVLKTTVIEGKNSAPVVVKAFSW